MKLEMFSSSYQRWYNYYFNEVADKRVADWPLMAGPERLVTILVVYLLSVYIFLPNYMKNRKPYSLKNVIFYYNIFQILTCMYLIVGTILNGWIQSKVALIGCTNPDYSDDIIAINQLKLIYTATLLKIVELIETVFFVLRKKQNQVSFLHVYHHTTTAILSWLVTKYIGGGMMTLPVIVNCFIHVLMYTYYTIASLGPQWQKKLAPWKPKLTAAQLIQFVILISHAVQVTAPGCKVPKLAIVLYIPNILVLMYLFSQFYLKNYTKKTKQT
ncbi:hypothetical protein WA026_017495 [Henosepilachna vigintioctopunctata]|uniref:Elongation of very long chain fatty acids protein n=1 Tax=Henosepilachna vigintioctopunctata TaxID=420089 RepID=A0AAW1UUQ5_9CUCU